MPLIAPDVGKLRQSGHDVADGVDAGLGGFLRLADLNEASVELDARLVDADVGSARGAAHGDQNLLGLLFDLLAVGAGPGDLHAGVGLLDLFDLRAGVHVDAALFEYAREFLRDLFIFGRHEARQELDQRHLSAEAA